MIAASFGVPSWLLVANSSRSTVPSLARSEMARNTDHGTPRVSHANAIAAVSMSRATTPWSRRLGEDVEVGRERVGRPHAAGGFGVADPGGSVFAPGRAVDHDLGQDERADRRLVLERACDADNEHVVDRRPRRATARRRRWRARCPFRSRWRRRRDRPDRPDGRVAPSIVTSTSPELAAQRYELHRHRAHERDRSAPHGGQPGASAPGAPARVAGTTWLTGRRGPVLRRWVDGRRAVGDPAGARPSGRRLHDGRRRPARRASTSNAWST